MSNIVAKSSDFTFHPDQSLFLHDETDMMLDADFVLLFENEVVNRVFEGATGLVIDEQALEDMRSIVREYIGEEV